MNELSLFTGAGGGVLGSLLLGWRTVGYVEWDDYCQRVLRQRLDDGILHEAPIFGNIETFISDGYADGYKGMVDVITAGFPCQPFSVAGKRKGELDDRNMWPATIETIRRVGPRYALLENVPGLLATEYFGTVLKDLAESGYDVRWKVISAGELGAPHRRDRLWIAAFRGGAVSNSESRGRGVRSAEDIRAHGGKSNPFSDGSEILADTGKPRLAQRQEPENGRGVIRQEGPTVGKGCNLSHANYAEASRQREYRGEIYAEPEAIRPIGSSGITWWDSDPADVGDTATIHAQGLGNGQEQGESWGTSTRPTQPRLGRVANGVAHRVDRLKAIGNGQVPAVVRAAWEILTESIEKEKV